MQGSMSTRNRPMGSHEVERGNHSHVLDAALQLFLEHGFRRTTMDDVARRAGIGRATVYRAFSDKNSLMQAVVMREFLRAIVAIEQRLLRVRRLDDRVVEAFVMVVQEARSHPLIRRLFDIEPEWFLPHFTVKAAPLLELGRHYLGTQLDALQQRGSCLTLDTDHIAELLLRLLQSLVLTPGSLVSADDERSLRHYARHFLLPLLFGGSRHSPCSTQSMQELDS